MDAGGVVKRQFCYSLGQACFFLFVCVLVCVTGDLGAKGGGGGGG